MSRQDWIDRVEADHLAIDAELRRMIALARSLDYPQTVRTRIESKRASRSGGATLTISVPEARALLRGTMPILPQRRRARERHARMFAALAIFQARLPGLTLDPVDRHVLAAARQLAEALDAWIAELAWRRATSTAGVSWPVPAPITAVTQPSTTDGEPDLFQEGPESPARATSADRSAPAAATSPAKPRRQRAQAQEAA